jgi:hypothetical protein
MIILIKYVVHVSIKFQGRNMCAHAYVHTRVETEEMNATVFHCHYAQPLEKEVNFYINF